MTHAPDRVADDSHMPPLFAHATRKDWGVGVLAWELGGKRGYLFDDGVERTLASGFYQLMNRVEQPTPEQQVASLRLQRVLSGRASARHLMIETEGPTFYDQVTRLRKSYPGGFLDAKWLEELRGEGTKLRSSRHRTALVREAAEQLSMVALDALLANQHYGQVWELMATVLSHSDLVPKTQLKQPKSSRGEPQRELALSAREMLYGSGPYEKRFDRFVLALTAHCGEAARWEAATALSAIVHPSEHVCVHPTVFRQQFKVIGSTGSPPAARPSGAAYVRALAATRVVAAKLAEQGEVPCDLLDVHDFIRITLKPLPKVRLKTPKAPSRGGVSEGGGSGSHDEDGE